VRYSLRNQYIQTNRRAQSMVAIRLSSRERKYSLVAGIVCIVYGFTMYVVHAKTLAKTPVSAQQPTAVRYTPPPPKKIKPAHKAAVAAVHSEALPPHVTQQAAAPVPVVSPPCRRRSSHPLRNHLQLLLLPRQCRPVEGRPWIAPPVGYGFAPSTSSTGFRNRNVESGNDERTLSPR